MRPPRVWRTRPHLEAVLHHPQREPPGELVRPAPPNIPPGLARSRQGLGDQRRLADARLTLDPEHGSLTAAQGLHARTQDGKLV
jgi:hypothetical protein